MAIYRVLAIVIAALGAGCTSMGSHDYEALKKIDFGPARTVRLCVLLDDGISAADARSLLTSAWTEEERRAFGIDFEVVRFRRWFRPGYTVDAIVASLVKEPLEPPCDRVLAFVNRTFGDFVWGFFWLPEVYGYVTRSVLTHGYVVARMATLQQAILLATPASILNHELYHLLGCTEHWNMGLCYEQIAQLKRADAGEFFPAWSPITTLKVITKRQWANELLGLEREQFQ